MPRRFGSGLPVGLGTSIACGVPVVSTPVGAEGFGLTDGTDALVCATAFEFARGLERLHGDGVLRAQLAEAAVRRLKPFRPDAIARDFAAIVESAGFEG